MSDADEFVKPFISVTRVLFPRSAVRVQDSQAKRNIYRRDRRTHQYEFRFERYVPYLSRRSLASHCHIRLSSLDITSFFGPSSLIIALKSNEIFKPDHSLQGFPICFVIANDAIAVVSHYLGSFLHCFHSAGCRRVCSLIPSLIFILAKPSEKRRFAMFLRPMVTNPSRSLKTSVVIRF